MAIKSLIRAFLTVFSIILLAVALVYLLKRSVLEHSPDIDFRFVWTAGKLWSLGIDPYSPRFTTLGKAMFPTGNDIAYWLYPPQWWVIARPLAALPVAQALVIWRAFNAVLLLAAAAALALAVQAARAEIPAWALLSSIAIMALMEGTAQTLLLGQTSILVFAGFCLLGVALLTSGQVPMVAALVLLLLKPQFAVPIIVCLAMRDKWRIPVAIAIAVTCIASLPQVLQYGLLPTARGLLGNLALHGQLPSNQPENLIGVSHLVWLFTRSNLANGWDIALDLMATGAIALLICRGSRPYDPDPALVAIGLIAPGMFFLPLHEYDTVALGPIAILALLLRGTPQYFAWAAVAVAFRPGIISAQFGDRDSGELFSLSLAGLFAVIAAIAPSGVRRSRI